MGSMARRAEAVERTGPALAATTSRPGYDAAKRALDVAVSGLLLLLLGPAMALIAAWIRRDSPGPALFRQTRVGRDGRTFTCYKFRSMVADADQGKHREYIRSLLTAAEQHAGPGLYKVPDDPRVTRAGAFLRKTSLDELPQLWNVFIGDMSLVGPRPAIGYEVEMYAPWVRERLTVLPGMTGFWQVNGRSSVGLEEMFRLDVSYVRRRSLRLDLWLLVRTIPAVITPRRAA